MTTCTLKDTATTTITFNSFTEITDRLDSKVFIVVALPDNEPPVLIQLLSWVRMFKVTFQLLTDETWPSSGESCSDKYANLVNLLKTGGDSEGLLELKFDREDSTPTTPVLESYNGCVKNLQKRVVTGEHTVKIDGDFEFYEGEIES